MSGASRDETLMVSACMEAAQGLRSLSLSILRGCPLLTTWEMGA